MEKDPSIPPLSEIPTPKGRSPPSQYQNKGLTENLFFTIRKKGIGLLKTGRLAKEMALLQG